MAVSAEPRPGAPRVVREVTGIHAERDDRGEPCEDPFLS